MEFHFRWSVKSGLNGIYFPMQLTLKYSQSMRAWLVTSRLGTGKTITFFYSASVLLFCNGEHGEVRMEPNSVLLSRSKKGLKLPEQPTSPPHIPAENTNFELDRRQN
jgi:hypothetical protein